MDGKGREGKRGSGGGWRCDGDVFGDRSVGGAFGCVLGK